jgi:CheY-like chemotaxis protein
MPARRGAVLVVEDRDDVRNGMAQLLELHGFVVVDAADGEHALGHLHADPSGFALILLDLMLPGALNGAQLRERQLAHPTLRSIPTIVVSAEPRDVLAASSTVEGLGLSGVEGWVSKPYRFDDLLAIVKRYVTPEAGALVTD